VEMKGTGTNGNRSPSFETPESPMSPNQVDSKLLQQAGFTNMTCQKVTKY